MAHVKKLKKDQISYLQSILQEAYSLGIFVNVKSIVTFP